jgi:hypothetical protein
VPWVLLDEGLDRFSGYPTLRRSSVVKGSPNHRRPTDCNRKIWSQKQPGDLVFRKPREIDQPFWAQVKETSEPRPPDDKRGISRRRQLSRASGRSDVIVKSIEREGPTCAMPLSFRSIVHYVEG